MSDIDATLQERGKRYGEFKEHARITQNIKDAMRDSPNWHVLSGDKKECLEMIAHKAGRILNGDPEYHDSWHDIVGYTKLVADTLLDSSCSTRLTHIEPMKLSEENKIKGRAIIKKMQTKQGKNHD